MLCGQNPYGFGLTGIVLSIAYWALVLFGIQSYVSRRLFEGVMGDYLKKMNEEKYYNDIKEIAKENKLANWMFKDIWSSNHERKDRYKGMIHSPDFYTRHCFSHYGYLL